MWIGCSCVRSRYPIIRKVLLLFIFPHFLCTWIFYIEQSFNLFTFTFLDERISESSFMLLGNPKNIKFTHHLFLPLYCIFVLCFPPASSYLGLFFQHSNYFAWLFAIFSNEHFLIFFFFPFLRLLIFMWKWSGSLQAGVSLNAFSMLKINTN